MSDSACLHRQDSHRERHGALLLVVLFCVGSMKFTSRLPEAFQLYALSISAPVLLLLCGRMSRRLSAKAGQLGWLIASLGAVYVCNQMAIFWSKVIAGQKTSLALLTTSNQAGLFLVIAECLVLTVLAEHWRLNRGVLLAGTLILGVVSGYVSPLSTNVLCLNRLLVCLPLFLAGRWFQKDALEKLLDKKSAKAVGAAILLVLLLVFVAGYDFIAPLKPLFQAKSYANLNTPALGGVFRLGHYALALAAGAALLALCPQKPLPVVTSLAEGWYSGLFWCPCVLTLLNALPVFSTKGTAGLLVRMALCILISLGLCWKPIAELIRSLFRLPSTLSGSYQTKTTKQYAPWVAYCLVFLLLLSVLISPFMKKGTSLVWQPDGENLYLVIMYYTRDYIVGVLKTLFSTGKLIFPQWDFSIGQGAGILSVLHVNPFFLLAVLFPRSAMGQVYGAVTLLQVFLSGLAFISFCRSIGKKDNLPVMTGSLIYAFSGYSIFTLGKHIYFITYLVLGLPLLLWSCERWLQKRKWGMFVAVIVFLFLGGYYYTWMDSLIMAFYLLVREVYVHRTNIKKIVAELLQMLGLYLWGLALSMVVFLPSILNLFGSSRSPTNETVRPLLYEAEHYTKLISLFVSLCPDAQNWTRLGFVGLVLITVIVLFLRGRQKEWRPLQVLTVLFAVFLCVPFMGSVFNGFGYVSNRWSFGFAMLMGVAVVYVLPQLVTLSRKEQIITTTLVAVYMGVCLYLDHDREGILSMVLLAVILAAVLLSCHMPNKALAQRCVSLVSVLVLLFHIGYYYSPDGLNESDSYLSNKEVSAIMTTSAEAVGTDLDDGLYRTEVSGNRHNVFCLTGGNGTTTYWSVLDGNTVDYYLDFDLDSARQLYALWGLDQRASLCALAGVKYYVDTNDAKAPYGFEKIDTDEESGFNIYQNQYALPFGYTYTSWIDQETYDALTPLEKQQAIMQGAVLSAEDGAATGLDTTSLSLTASNLDWEVSDTENVTIDGTVFTVEKDGGTVTLSFDGVEDCETYVYLNGVEYTNGSSKTQIKVSAGDVSKRAEMYREDSLYYFDRHGYTYNLGYNEKALKKCTLVFDKAGTYTMDSLGVVCLPMSDYLEDVTALGETVLENVEETANGLTGSLELTDTRLLTFAVPYSSGWTLYANGEEVELMQVNGMYQGVVLDAGSYDLVLEYTAPGQRLGLYISALAAVSMAACGVLHRVRRKKE